MWTTVLAAVVAAGISFSPPAQPGEVSEADATNLRAAFKRALNADVQAEYEALAARKLSGEKSICEKTGSCDVRCDCAPAAQLLAYRLKSTPDGWTVVAPLFREQLSAESKEAQARALDLLAWNGGAEPARAIVDEIYEKEPQLFSRDQVLAFAEGGSKSLWHEATKRAKTDPRCAAFIALHSDKVVSDALAQALKGSLKNESEVLDAYAAAAALKKLGRDGPWTALQERVHDEVVAALDNGELDRARDLALAAEFCAKGANGTYGLSYLEGRLAFHRAARAGELANADQVFELIEKASTL